MLGAQETVKLVPPPHPPQETPDLGAMTVHLPSQLLTGMLLKYLRFARCQV